MSDHSKEPWRVAGDRPEGVIIMSADDRIVAVAVPPHRGRIDAGTRADADRIVACVNLCAGVPTGPGDTPGREDAGSAAVELLRRLVEAGPDMIGGPGECGYCGRRLRDRFHAPDCPYMAARAFLEGVGP